ncbi:MAG: arabinan endo-1,5-alpha-L-arabinosidase [Muribaculum sp.]|nr:arabinan endo-1,5-alpha-L-arabinosidase [Muribaculum sp.]
MKIHRISLPLCLAAFLAGTSCSADKFSPVSSVNPWVDDYSEVAVFDSINSWGTYNVHDPAMTRVGDTYYMYSTDAIYFARPKGPIDTAAMRQRMRERPRTGNVQMRRSKDLVNWEFIGWAFPEIPQEPVDWVRGLNQGMRGAAGNVWAPYMVAADDGTYRLYYCVSAFGRKTSAISMATADSPEGPWTHQGCVVKTDNESPMNAIDPSVITGKDGRQWMHYGSYFGGLYCVELDPATGFTKEEGDKGHLVNHRQRLTSADNNEGPEIIYSPEHDMYYLFTSYDPLESTYNVRVSRSKTPEGPFVDFFGKEASDTTDNFPILTAPYRFEGHPGWVGNGHCGVVADADGHFYMAHQGRYAPTPGMMDLHLRQIFFTPDGWPVVSPERYTATAERKFASADLEGTWEIIRIREPRANKELNNGVVPRGFDVLSGKWNTGKSHVFASDGTITGKDASAWELNEEKQLLNLTVDGEVINNLVIFAGHDWERELDTILFTGLDKDGRSVWGKRII